MAITIKEDLFDVRSRVIHNESGLSVTRVFMITGLNDNADQRMPEAYTAMDSIHGKYPRSSTDELPFGIELYASSIVCEPVSPTAARAVVTWTPEPVGDAENARAEIRATLQQETITHDQTGENQLTVTYTPPGGQPIVQPQQLKVGRPVAAISFSRKLTGNYQNVLHTSLDHTGAVNQHAWLGKESKTFLCTSVIVTTVDQNQRFHQTYTFQYNPERWIGTLTYIDPDTGRPPAGISGGAGNGKDEYNIYPEVDFAALKLEPWSAPPDPP